MQISSDMIRKPLLMVLFALLCTLPMYAGINDWYVHAAPGYFVNPLQRHTFGSVKLGMEKQLSRSSCAGFDIYARSQNLYTKADFRSAEYSIAGYWKPNVLMSKNQDLYIALGGNLGTSSSAGITFGLNLGFEYDLTFANGMKFFIAQDNLLVFRSPDRLVCGLSAGVKIPLAQ